MVFAWQGWQLAIPDEWSPAKLHGTFNAGYALLSDIHHPRIGIRWTTPGRRFDPTAWSRRALVDEVGQLAAGEAEKSADDGYHDSWLYSEPDPPGRDVWVAVSRASGRTIEIVHHVQKGERSRIDHLQKSLRDSHKNDELSWSIFDLSCRTPRDWLLESHRLNAGDLTLSFARKSQTMGLRQVAVARLALKRMTIEQWLESQIGPRLKRFRETEKPVPLKIPTEDGRTLHGVSQRLDRRKRFALSGIVPPRIWSAALHDETRDRLLFIEAQDPSTGSHLARSVGWASEPAVCQ